VKHLTFKDELNSDEEVQLFGKSMY